MVTDPDIIVLLTIHSEASLKDFQLLLQTAKHETSSTVSHHYLHYLERKPKMELCTLYLIAIYKFPKTNARSHLLPKEINAKKIYH